MGHRAPATRAAGLTTPSRDSCKQGAWWLRDGNQALCGRRPPHPAPTARGYVRGRVNTRSPVPIADPLTGTINRETLVVPSGGCSSCPQLDLIRAVRATRPSAGTRTTSIASPIVARVTGCERVSTVPIRGEPFMNRIAITRPRTAGHRATHRPAPPQPLTGISAAVVASRWRAA